MNALIQIDEKNLRRPLIPLQAMQLCNFRAKIIGVPKDVNEVLLVVYKTNGEHFVPIPCSQNENGDFFVNIVGGCFPTAGEAKYQIGFKDIDGNTYAGGFGKILITAFDPIASGTPLPDGGILLTEIPDDSGVAHRIKAVQVDGEWTWRMAD